MYPSGLIKKLPEWGKQVAAWIGFIVLAVSIFVFVISFLPLPKEVKELKETNFRMSQELQTMNTNHLHTIETKVDELHFVLDERMDSLDKDINQIKGSLDILIKK
jgi:FtsZ-binding cell division protein ZapB